MKLEDQLLKLKEEREDLKERGNRHEDKIMRENAKLQVNIALLAITLCFKLTLEYNRLFFQYLYFKN